MAITEKTNMVQVSLEYDDYEKLGVLPWFSYRIDLPERPLPPNADRPHFKTDRLLIRPFLSSDLEAFHALRSVAATQNESTTRGRPDRDLDESKQNLEWFQAEDQHHWYFGAFLQSTGELIGEGGLPDCDGWRSGRPEAEFLIRPEHCRKGYGTEFWNAVMTSWWDLPREKRRYQLHPFFVAPDKEPGDEVADAVGFVWEETNDAARNFFTKMQQQATYTLAASGFFVDFDKREGREGTLVRWEGTLAVNPRSDVR
jgi:RimJ/RimL family protein N-acetyltransferase